MKRWIATILSISLVIGMAAVLHACGKPKTEPETTTTEEVTLPAASEAEENVTNEWAEIFDGFEDLSFTEVTTDEHYQEEYNALTLPMAVTTQKAVGTTRAQTTVNPSVRETTTQFMFTSPSRASTTKQEPAGSTAAANESTTTTKPSTTAPEQTAAEETQIADVVGNVDVPAIQQELTTPQATYLRRYVLDVFKTGVYTWQMEGKEDGAVVPITVYSDGNNLAGEVSLASILAKANDYDLPASLAKIGKIRLVIKGINSSNPKVYYVLPSGDYYEATDEVDSELFGMMKEENILLQMVQGDLQYVGETQGTGYVCESYRDSENKVQRNFFFCQTSDGYFGLVRIDEIDLETGKTVTQIVTRLYDKVTDKKAFDIKGKKLSEADLEKMIPT